MAPPVAECRLRSPSMRALQIVGLLSALFAAQSPVSEPRPPYVPEGTPAELGLAGYAKILCSGVFVSGRDPVEAATNSAYWMIQPTSDAPKVTYTIDRATKTVVATLGEYTKSARY